MTSELKFYHCGDPSKMEVWKGDLSECWHKTLCGLSTSEVGVWDAPSDFNRETPPARHWLPDALPKCPKCLNHPDYPLLLLGDLP